ncbi:hypothetical protein GCM10022222_62040 [Amycolatopsis ultiminotia]|uniref:Secreted protein n=1 Tax=Amycolatopsis ultiminotia TaxID=543629 RepID=A0ABP6XME7_9PSEU
MIKRRRIGAAAAALGMAALALPVYTAAPAAASSWPIWEVRTTDKWAGYGKFDHDGDRILAADQDVDGRSIVVVWKTDYGRSGTCKNSQGGGVEKVCNYNLSEQGRIQIKACLSNNGSAPYGCGKPSNWVSIGDGTGY